MILTRMPLLNCFFGPCDAASNVTKEPKEESRNCRKTLNERIVS